MVLDKHVFGHTEFEVTDTTLFKNNDHKPFKVKLNNSNVGRSSVYEPVELCQETTISWQDCPWLNNGQLCRGETFCDRCPQCVYNVTYTYCWIEWIEVGGSGGTNGGEGGGSGNGNGGSGGSGGTSGGNTPPDCSGGSTTGNRNATNLPCGPGWTPIYDNPPPPPPNDTILSLNLGKLYLKGVTLADFLFQEALQDNRERAFTFIRNNNGDSVAMWPVIGQTNSTAPTITNNSFAIWHAHQDEGQNDIYKDQSFDAPDLFKLYKHRNIDNLPLEVSFITSRNWIYAVIITDPIKFKNHFASLANSTHMYLIADSLESKHIRAWNKCLGCSWQRGSEIGTLSVLANNNSEVSGVKIFKSSKQTINFTVLTP